jgi:CRP/FNR family transcriptional regulator, cyclic AMP receptor protein
MLIEQANLFRGLNRQLVEEIGKCCVGESHPAGAFLFRHGEPADYLYILVEGRVRLSIGDLGHIALVVGNPGDAFGWSSLVERENYTASAECLVSTRVTRIGKKVLAEIFERNPESGLQFYKRLATLIAQRLTDTYKLIPAAHGEKRAAPGF